MVDQRTDPTIGQRVPMIEKKQVACFVLLILIASTTGIAAQDGAADARRKSIEHSYGTYDGNVRTADHHIDNARLLSELGELHANTYNWLIAYAATDWNDLHTFLPLARKNGIRIWVTVMPPSESPPRAKSISEPYRLNYEKWAAELAALSVREPALAAWSIDDFAYNLKIFTPDRMRAIIAAQRAKNPSFAFVPCIYYKQATPQFAKTYARFFDGILFPYYSESTTIGLTDATQVAPEVRALKARFGHDFPIVVDVYATRHTRIGVSTPEYVEQVMQLAHPVADGVHIFTHQDKRRPEQRAKYDVIRRVMSSWPQE